MHALQNSIFDLQQDCEYDSVVVKKSNNADTSEVFCGTTRPALITSDSHTLLVEFTSDNTVQRTGFSAAFFIGNPS